MGSGAWGEHGPELAVAGALTPFRGGATPALPAARISGSKSTWRSE